MNLQIIEGQQYLNEKNGYAYTAGFGRIRNMNFVIVSGEMSDPESFKAQANASIFFCADKEAAIAGKSPIFTLEIALQDTDIINILNIDSEGYSISEKKLYDYLLTIDDNANIFEII